MPIPVNSRSFRPLLGAASALALFAVLGTWPASALAGPPQAPGPIAGPPGPAKADDTPRDVAYALVNGKKVSLFSPESGRVPVASVDTSVITMDEFVDALTLMHESPATATAGKRDFTPVLDRLINLRLVALEAREMGMDERPEFTSAISSFKETTLREILKRRATAGATADSKKLEEIYREASREWKVKSVLFAKEEDAKAMQTALKSGKSFDALAAQAVAAKKAKGAGEAQFLPRTKMLTQVEAAVRSLTAGKVSPTIRLPDGFAIMRVDAVRQGDDPKLRGEIEASLRSAKVNEALHKYFEALVKKHATVDKALLKRLDYNAAKKGVEAFRKDARPLARIRGEKPVTVADLTAELDKKMYHGADRAAKSKRLNQEKQGTFESLLFRRLLDLEARQQNLASSYDVQRRVAEQEQKLLFGMFVEKVVIPEVDVKEEEGKRYYDAHKSEYMYPDFFRLETVAFAKSKDAQSALAKLRAGADPNWLRQNADGVVQDPPLHFDSLVSARSLPDDVAKALSGARKGDSRLYTSGEGPAYVLLVSDHTPAQPQPYTEVRSGIVKTLYTKKVNDRIDEWAKKLRAARDVKVFITQLGG